MQLSQFTYIFLTLCVPFFAYIIKSTEPKKGFSILFSAVIAMNIFLYMNQFSYIGAFFLAMYLNFFKRSQKFYLLLLSFISFVVGAFTLVGQTLFYVCIANNDGIFCIFFNDDRTLVFGRSYNKQGWYEKHCLILHLFINWNLNSGIFWFVREFIKFI